MQGTGNIATHDAGATRQALRLAEDPLIESRRRQLGLEPIDQAPRVGLALSGGGIRSATFCLGLLQALSASGALRRFDYLSTVSGGGYAAAFLGALLRAPSRFASQPTPARATDGYAFAERVLRGDEERTQLRPPPGADDPDRPLFHPMRWLRESGRYLTPTRGNDWPFAVAYYLRSLAAVHVVGATASMFLFAAWVLAQVAAGLPVSTVGIAASPLWMAAAAAAFLFGTAGFAYWATSDAPTTTLQRVESWLVKATLPALAVAGIAGGLMGGLVGGPAGGLLGGLAGGTIAPWMLAGGVFATVSLGFFVAAGWGHHHVETSRRRLTGWAAALASAAAVLSALAGVDTLARHLAFNPGAAATVMSSTAAALAALALLLLRTTGGPAAGRLSTLTRRFAAPSALLVGTGICTVLAASYALAAYRAALAPHATAWLPPMFWLLTALTGSASVLHLLSPGFLNLSTFHHLYAARLTRSYLGAANFHRLRQQRDGVMDRDAWLRAAHDDDLWTLRQYYGVDGGPTAAPAGDFPIHLVNTTLAERRGGSSDITQRDRKGLILSIGPAGMTIGTAHFPWRSRAGDSTLIDHAAPLRLGNWIAISGAAFSAGVGAQTRLGFALLAALFNIRLGYWWSAPAELRVPHPATRAERLRQASRALTHRCLIAEMTGGFWGRRSARWYLSDGGHFENTGVYELIRRRVPFIVVSDNGADPAYAFRDLGNLARKARVDLGAQIEVLGAEALRARLPVDLLPLFGPQSAFQDATLRAHRTMPAALLARVRFDDEPDAAPLTLLIIKPALIDDLPADLRHYASAHPRFPQEPTVDQFFDEAQWESYRRLGELIGGRLFAAAGAAAGTAASASAGAGAAAAAGGSAGPAPGETAKAWRPARFAPLDPPTVRRSGPIA